MPRSGGMRGSGLARGRQGRIDVTESERGPDLAAQPQAPARIESDEPAVALPDVQDPQAVHNLVGQVSEDEVVDTVDVDVRLPLDAAEALPALADICAAERVWFHVDAADGGFAVLTSRGAAALEGIDRADSINADPHKWLFQPCEAGCVLVRDAGTLERAFAIQHDVLQDSVWGAKHANLADQGIHLSRGFRALKVWMSI